MPALALRLPREAGTSAAPCAVPERRSEWRGGASGRRGIQSRDVKTCTGKTQLPTRKTSGSWFGEGSADFARHPEMLVTLK